MKPLDDLQLFFHDDLPEFADTIRFSRLLFPIEYTMLIIARRAYDDKIKDYPTFEKKNEKL